MNENEQLGITLKANLENANEEIAKTVKELKNAGLEIKSIQRIVSQKGLDKYTIAATDGVKKLNIQLDETGKKLQNISKVTYGNKLSILGTMFNGGKLYLMWNLTKRIRQTVGGWVTNAIDFQETVNKFNVAMGSSVVQATKFQNKLSEAFGTAKDEMMDYQATFKNILSGLGNLSTKTTEQISETLVKMGLDYSSLFNVSQAGAMSKFQSALTGSIVPIRKDSGYDVSDLTIVAKAQQLGVDKSSSQLSQVEKRILKIIVLMEQMKNTGAFQDLARTIESPSNQLKVLQNQLKEVGVWLGNVFVGTLGRVLPYINGFVMALKEVIKMLAIFVGYKEELTGLDDLFDVTADGTDGIANGLGTAVNKAKELKKTMMGFDVLNVIQTPTQSSSDSGAGGVGSIDPKILNALAQYDSMMENVRMKATDIRDKIMEWLGFTQEINPETGEISWKLNDGYTNLEKIRDVLIIIAGLGILVTIIKIVGWISKLGLALQGIPTTQTSLQLGLAKIGSLFKALAAAIGITTGTLAAILGVILLIVAGVYLMYQNFDKLKEKFNSLSDTAKVFVYILAVINPIIGIIVTITLLIKGVQYILENGWGAAWEKTKEIFENVKTTVKGAFDSIVEWLEKLPYNLGYALGQMAAKGYTFFTVKVPELWKKFIDWKAKKETEFIEGFVKLFNKVKEKFLNGLTKVIDFAKEFIEDPKKGFQKIGELIVEGLQKGIEWVWEHSFLKKVKEFFDGFIDGVKDTLGIHSPSTIFKDIGINLIEGLLNGLSTFTSKISDWWDNKVKPWFTWEKWKGLGTDAVNAVKTAFDNFKFNIKTPHFKVDGGEAPYGIAGQGKPPSFKVDWYKYGGFPKTGDIFGANEDGKAEFIGRIGNQTAVANNDQIVAAVSQGVAQAVSSVLGQGFGGTQTIKLVADGRELTELVVNRMNRMANISGT